LVRKRFRLKNGRWKGLNMKEIRGTVPRKLGIRYSEYDEKTVEGVREARGCVRIGQLPAVGLLLLDSSLSG
jgi:hypothetical protein